MSADELRLRLRETRIVPLSAEEWTGLAPAFDEIERHDTRLAGELVIFEDEGVFFAVEEPSRDHRVIRRLESEEEVRAFVTKRFEEYERMWDGCGCKVEYYR